MFGLFKSKEDKEVEKIVSRIMKHREELIFDGNIVHELGQKVINKYKLTSSTIEPINLSGLLPTNIKDSGYVVIAIDERHAMYINYDKRNYETIVGMGSTTLNMLEDIRNGLDEELVECNKGHGFSYKIGMINLIGAITVLGHEVGIPESDDGDYFPFDYKGHKFYLVDYEDASWIVYEHDINLQLDSSTKNTKEDNQYIDETTKKDITTFEEFITNYDLSEEGIIAVNEMQKMNLQSDAKDIKTDFTNCSLSFLEDDAGKLYACIVNQSEEEQDEALEQELQKEFEEIENKLDVDLDKYEDNLNGDTEQFDDAVPMSGQELYEKYSDRELNNQSKTISFLFKVSNSIDTTGRIIDKWTAEEILTASNKYDKLTDQLLDIEYYQDLIEFLNLDINTYDEIKEYEDWFINDYYPSSKKIYMQAKSRGRHDEINELAEKLLIDLFDTFDFIEEGKSEYEDGHKYKQYIKDRQHIIDKLNKAMIDYLDIIRVHHDTVIDADNTIAFEMKTDADFSLMFNTHNDMQIAIELVNYKIKHFNDDTALERVLKSVEKLDFIAWMIQYKLNPEEKNAIFKWDLDNQEKELKKRVTNFRDYGLEFNKNGAEITAILIHPSEMLKRELQKELDEIPF